MSATHANAKRIRELRLRSLLLSHRAAGQGRSVPDIVRWFGALQGQDLGSVAWSLGLRTGLSRAEIDLALGSGAVLRTWPMRGTIHLVPGIDARWMVEHLGARALRGARQRWENLGITQVEAARAVELLADRLDSGPLTRAACLAALREGGIATDGQRGYHFLWYASQTGVTCMGPPQGSEQTFALLSRFAPAARDLDRGAALATAAERFIRSHGPVTVHDFARWADLTMADARAGVAAVDGCVRIEEGGQVMYLMEAELAMAEDTPPAWALPGFDEFILGYRDRTAQIDREYERRIVPGGNGVFAPTLVVGGRVVGSWKRKELTSTVRVTATAFEPVAAADRGELEAGLGRFAEYLGKALEVVWVDDPQVLGGHRAGRRQAG